MRVIFVGSGDFGLPTLERLWERHEVVAVVSQPDRPAGRKRKLTPTPVAQWARERGLEVLKAEDVNTADFVERVRGWEAEASVVVAFGQKLSPELIGALGGLVVNLHGSLLPKYRGAAPINRAVMEGERVTGVTVIGLAQRMDAGEMYGKAELEVDPRETAGEVHDRLAALGPGVVERVLADYGAGRLEAMEQSESEATRAPKLGKAEGTVDFAESAERVRARVHGLTPWPGCRVNWDCVATGERQVLILRRVEALGEEPDFVRRRWEAEGRPAVGTVVEPLLVVTGRGLVKLLEVQGPGTKPMSAEAFSRGHQLGAGDRLSPTGERA